MRIGKDQLQTLIMLGSPTMLLPVPGRSERGLVKRGLLRERAPGKSCCITPAGLRVLAAEMEAGRVDDALEAMRKQVAKRQRRIAEKAKARGDAYDARALSRQESPGGET